MAYFRKLKLDPNFEDWLDSKILKLKAEGVLESDPEEGEEEEEEGKEGVGVKEEWRAVGGVEEEPQFEVDEEYVWGEDPIGGLPDTELTAPPLSSDLENDDTMTTKMRKASTDLDDADNAIRHVSSEVGGDYYQFVWESDEEADIFDRDEYQLGHDTGLPRADMSHVKYNHIEPNIHVANPGDNIGSAPRSLGGLVLGIGRKDVEVAYTRLQGARSGSDTTPNWERNTTGDWDLDLHEEQLPDPRFSIDEQDAPQSSSNISDVPMLEMPGSRSKLRAHGRNSRVRNAASGGASSGTARGVGTVPVSADGHLPDKTIEGATYGKDRVFLPMDSMEMTMTSDDDDDIIDDDNFDVHSELAPDTAHIITVDQANLIAQWRSKSQRTKTAILAGIVCGALLVFGVVTYLIVHILTTSG